MNDPWTSRQRAFVLGWTTYATALSQRLTGVVHSADGLRYPQAAHVAELAIREFKPGHAQASELALPV